MNRKARLICIAAGLAIASTAATADAAKPMTAKERAAKSQEIQAAEPINREAERAAKTQELRQNHRSFQQPRTIAQAELRAMPLAGGGTALAAPTELWNHLSATRGPDGQIRVHEAEGQYAAPAQEDTHE